MLGKRNSHFQYVQRWNKVFYARKHVHHTTVVSWVRIHGHLNVTHNHIWPRMGAYPGHKLYTFVEAATCTLTPVHGRYIPGSGHLPRTGN